MAQTERQNQLTKAGMNNAGLLSLGRLTVRQREVYDLLVAYINQHGYPPTTKELSDLIGVSSQNAAVEHLRALERKGIISIARGKSRSISVAGTTDAVQLLNAVLNGEPGARERAEVFIRQHRVGRS